MSNPTLIPAQNAGTLRLADATQVSAAGIVSRTVLQSPEMRVVLFTFADGQELTTHTNTRRAVIQVLEGTGEFFFNGRWEKLSAGTLLHLPPSAPHGVRAGAGPFSMLLTLGAELREPAPAK
jgi:quercetin dioxygenase-like cupin family protein